MIKKKIVFEKSLITLVLAILLISFASAFGVSSPFWRGNPISVSPGETGSVNLTLQNMIGTEDITVRAVLTKGSEIASVEEKDYLIKAGTKDTKVQVDIRIPPSVPVDTSYVVAVSFETVNSGAGGGVAIGTGIDTNFDVLVVPLTPVIEKTELSPEEGKSTLVYWVIGAIILIAIAIAIVLKKGKKKSFKK